MLLTILRTSFTSEETLGSLLIDGKPFCSTLEPPVVPNAQHPKGAIPAGWYRLTLTRSPKFGRILPLLHYVPGFEGIRLHAGNRKEDTAGCILVGERAAHSKLLFNARQTEQSLVEILQTEAYANHEIYIEITTRERYTVERLPQPAFYGFRCQG